MVERKSSPVKVEILVPGAGSIKTDLSILDAFHRALKGVERNSNKRLSPYREGADVADPGKGDFKAAMDVACRIKSIKDTAPPISQGKIAFRLEGYHVRAIKEALVYLTRDSVCSSGIWRDRWGRFFWEEDYKSLKRLLNQVKVFVDVLLD